MEPHLINESFENNCYKMNKDFPSFNIIVTYAVMFVVKILPEFPIYIFSNVLKWIAYKSKLSKWLGIKFFFSFMTTTAVVFKCSSVLPSAFPLLD